MVNVCVLWNTVHTARAIDAIRAEGKPVATADVARLSPLGFDHLNMLGRYNFLLPDSVRNGQLRPLRTPDQASNQNLAAGAASQAHRPLQ